MSGNLPPKDSWIELKPGAQVLLDERLCKEWAKLTTDYRQIRGNFLAACFEFEYMIDQIISETLFPGAEAPIEEALRGRRDCFDELLLKSGTLQFARKIELLRQLRSRFQTLEVALGEGVFPKLNKVREIRNKFAHYPVTFEPFGDSPNQTLVPWLVTRSSRIEVGEAFLKDYSTVFGEVARDLTAAIKQLRGVPEFEGDTPEAELGAAPDTAG